MNESMQKLTKISGVFRILVIVITAFIIAYIGYDYVVHDILSLSKDELFHELWNSSQANRGILFATQLHFLVSLVGIYWLQRLLQHFQQGKFFDDETFRCYLWLIWIKIINMLFDIVQQTVVGLYHRQIFKNTTIELTIDFGNMITLLLMLLIVYLLKAAKEIEAENKEFI